MSTPTTPPPIHFRELDRADRQRINYPDIPSLAESLYTSGFIHPLAINTDLTPPRLLAGGRRSTALDFILSNPLHFVDLELHPSMSSFITDQLLHFGIHYTIKTTESEQEHQILELVENVQRANLSWQEEMIALKRIHRLKSSEAIKRYERWTQQRTAALCNVAQSHVSYAVLLADHLSDPSSPLWRIGTVLEALQYLAKLKHDEFSKELVNKIKTRATVIPSITPTTPLTTGPTFLSTFDPSKFISSGIEPIDMGAEFSSAPPVDQPPPAPVTISDSDKDKIQEAYDVVSKLVYNLSFEEFCLQVPPESYDHILTDPPYAIEMDNLNQANVDRIEDTHDVGKNRSDFPAWIAGCYRILKPNGYCVWFCDQERWQELYDLAIGVGFKVQRWPLTWCKTTACGNSRAELNFTKTTEIAMVMRKGTAKLVSAQSTCYWIGGLTAEDKAAGVNHPFIKPRELWQWILKAIALPGSTVVDGFSGVGSGTRAMMLAGYTPIGVEKDENHYAQQIQNLTKTYCEMNGIVFK